MSPDFTLKVYGPPGAGKTEHQLRLMEDEVRNGTPAELIAYVTFGRDAAANGRRRALSALNRLGPGADDLPLFRTFHSLSWRLLHLGNPEHVEVKPQHRKTFCDWYQLDYEPTYDPGLLDATGAEERVPFGNQVFQADSWLTNNLLPLQHLPHHQQRFTGAVHDLAVFVERWRAYKAKVGRIEYADVLELCRVTNPSFPAIALFVDEFQDLSPLQYKLFEQWGAQVERVYITGDDDQTIYTFNGASPRFMLDAPADEVRKLPVTHRLSLDACEYARQVIEPVRTREPKPLAPCACGECVVRRGPRGDGRVIVLERPQFDSIMRLIDPLDSFVLARTRQKVSSFAALLRRNGVPYHTMRGPDAPGALWSRHLIRAKHLHSLMRDPEAHVPYGTALDILTRIEPFHAGTHTGFVRRERVAEFGKLPVTIGATWPITGLGEDLSSWSFSMLRRYFDRVPRADDIAQAFGLTADQADALDAHVRHNPTWPIDMRAGVCVGTIHASKGLDARTVVLLADTSKTANTRIHQREEDHDAERRVFFVGATRAQRRLVVVRPFTSAAYFPMPSGGAAA